MFPKEDRPALSTIAFVVVLIIVVVVGGAIGIYYPRPAQTASSASTTSSSAASSRTSTSSSVTTSSAASSSASTSSSQSSSVSSTTTTPPALAPPLFNFTLSSGPRTILISPGATLYYSNVYVTPLPSAFMGQGAGLNFGGGDELVVMNSAAPSGLSVHFFGSNLTTTIYEEVGAGFPSTVELELVAAPSIAPGNYPVSILASSGTLTVNYTFNVQVVQYLVLLNFNTFRPGNLNVTLGSTVYWINISGDPNAQYDIIFNTIKVQSPVLDPCPSNRPNGCTVFSYTFTTAGNFSYFCNVYSGMKGTITVTG